MAEQRTQRNQARGVADIVFRIDVSGSMAPVVDALNQNIGTFVESLSAGEGNHVSPVRDRRAVAVGFRDFEEDAEPLVDHPFVDGVEAMRAQPASLRAEGGGDEPGSRLDALFRTSTMEQTDQGA